MILIVVKEFRSCLQNLSTSDHRTWGKQVWALGESRMPLAHENRREYFRLELPECPATMQILEVGQRPITTHPRTVYLLNASGGGLYLVADEDLPVRRGVVAQFEFTLGQTQFSLRGLLIRKLDDRVTYKYGVQFIDTDEYQRGLLVSTLGRMQVELRKAGG